MKKQNPNMNKITFRTDRYTELESIATNRGSNISQVINDILEGYFNEHDLTLSLYSRIENTVEKLNQFLKLADDVSHKFSTMNSAEAYYFLRIKDQLDLYQNQSTDISQKMDQVIQILYLLSKPQSYVTANKQVKDLKSII